MLFGVKPSLCCESLSVSEVCRRAPSFYIIREARTWPLSPRQVGPMMYYKITYRTDIMALQATEILFLDFLVLPVGIFRAALPCPVLSKRRQGVACGVACRIAERAV